MMTGDPNGFSTQGSRRPQISETSVPGTGGSWANFFRTKKRITPRWARDLTRALGGPAATSAASARPRHPSTGSERRVQGRGADESLRKARKLAPDETSRKNSPEPSLFPLKIPRGESPKADTEPSTGVERPSRPSGSGPSRWSPRRGLT